MRAAVYHGPGDLRIESIPAEPLGPRDVRIAVSHCGVCGTDLHGVIDGWEVPGVTPGHELSGTVVETGDDVHDLEPGTAVTAVPQRPCGTCSGCRSGRPSLCDEVEKISAIRRGGFAEQTTVHRDQVRALPEGVTTRTAALTEPLAVALHALTLAGFEPGQRVLVTGAGPLALLAVAAIRAFDAEADRRSQIVVSEPVEGRRRQAARVGADDVVTPDELTVPAIPIDLVADPYDIALEFAGRASAIEQCLGNLSPGGTLVVVGSGLDHPTVDPNRMLVHELVMRGAFNYDADGFDRALQMLASGALPLDELVEPDDVPLEQLADAMHRLRSGEVTRKTLVTPLSEDPT